MSPMEYLALAPKMPPPNVARVIERWDDGGSRSHARDRNQDTTQRILKSLRSAKAPLTLDEISAQLKDLFREQVYSGLQYLFKTKRVERIGHQRSAKWRIA